MQPEILTRCSSCGAAVREPAMFCPECGKAMTAAAQTESSAAAEIERAALTEAPPAEPVVPSEEQTPEAVELAAAAPQTVATTTDKPSEPAVPHGARERTRERLHRASNVARGAIEDNVKRVEKIHHVSTAMIEEAHYDSSLRFVLVALGLFVVFIILLVLSKVMG
jgi:uncharacterized OB-fold protein